MQIGYATVSTNDQDATAQTAELKSAGCKSIYVEQASGGRWDRPELHQLLDHMRSGDVLVAWRLDRLSRSLKDVSHIMERLHDLQAGFRSLTEATDTTSLAGRMLMQLLATFAEYEKEVVRERTRNGLLCARKQGRVGGRRRKLTAHQRTRSSVGRKRSEVHSRRGLALLRPPRDCVPLAGSLSGLKIPPYGTLRKVNRLSR